MLQGRYQIEHEIGAGAHGKVYRGRDHQTNTPIAIKWLRPGLVAGEPEILSRFQREADALRRLNHPNIVQAVAAFAEGDDHYIVMEYLSGGSLRNLMDETPCLPLERALRLALDLSDALARAHRLNIIHRDLKPANVLLADDGTPRLSDFGVALVRDAERVTDSHSVVGTLNYIAPEALNGEALDEAADVWSFGVMLYEMLAGRRPFVSENPTSLIVAILTHPPADLEQLRPDAPAALVDLIYRMLEKNPRARIPSVRRVGAELEAILRMLETGEMPIQPAASGVNTPPPATTKFDATPIVKNNLPAQTTPFIGRDWEIGELLRMLRPGGADSSTGPRLVTLLAPGGMGKSRLSLEVAARLLETPSGTLPYPDGVYFVPLAPLPTPDRIPGAIAEAVGYSMQGDGREPIQQIEAFLADRRILLILDNFEHLTSGADYISRILAAAPGLTVLITSRERINLSAEHLFTLEGLPTPSEAVPTSPLEYSAIQLFVKSAQRAHPKFKLEAADVPHVTTICRLVQGLPLGLVLAATWAEMLTPQEIAEELSKSAEFLEANMHDLPERHRSMRAVFEYSWQRLSAAEQRTLARLSVFRGPFSRAAAQAVTGSSLRDLMQLVNKSLLHRDTDTGYYTLHELIRQFAEGHLKTNEADYQSALDAHAYYYCFWLKDLLPAARGQQMQAVRPMDAEIDNIRQAWQCAADRREVTALEAAEETLYVYYRLRSLEGERLPVFNSAIEALESLEPSTERSRVLGRLCGRQGELYLRLLEIDKAREILERAVTLLRDNHDEIGLIFAISHLGEMNSRRVRDNPRSAALAKEGIALAQKHKIVAYEAMIKLWLAFRAHRDYHLEEGQEWARQAYELFRQIQQPEGQGDSLRAMGMLAYQTGNAQRAIETYHAAIPHYEAIGDLAGVNLCLMDEATAYSFLGDYGSARRATLQALRIMNEKGLNIRKANASIILGDISYMEGHYEQSLRELQEALRHRDHLGVSLFGNLYPLAYQARTLIAMERYDEADQLLKQVDSALQARGGHLSFPMRVRGQWYAAQGRYAEAETQYLRTIEKIFEDGRDHGALAYVVLGLAEVWHKQGRISPAVITAWVVKNSPLTWTANRQSAAHILEAIRPTVPESTWASLERDGYGTPIEVYAQALVQTVKR